MKSSIQIMLDAKRPRDGIAVCAAVDADLKKLADTFVKSAEGDWPNAAQSTAHYHLRRQVALHLLKAVMPGEVRDEAMHVVETLIEATDDVAGLTDNPDLEGSTYAAADLFEAAYSRATELHREERDDDRPGHPDRAAFGRGAL